MSRFEENDAETRDNRTAIFRLRRVFASVEQQARPALRGKPIGIVPFEKVATTCVIAASREAKKFGVKNVMNVGDLFSVMSESGWT